MGRKPKCKSLFACILLSYLLVVGFMATLSRQDLMTIDWFNASLCMYKHMVFIVENIFTQIIAWSYKY